MGRLIDYHQNCACGSDVHVHLAQVDDEQLGPALQMRTTTTGGLIERRIPLTDLELTPTTPPADHPEPVPTDDHPAGDLETTAGTAEAPKPARGRPSKSSA